jgi:hypothetical protein
MISIPADWPNFILKCFDDSPAYCTDMLAAIKEGKIELWGFVRNIRYNLVVDKEEKKLEIYKCKFCDGRLPYMWDTMKELIEFLQYYGIEEKFKSISPIFLNRQKSSELVK